MICGLVDAPMTNADTGAERPGVFVDTATTEGTPQIVEVHCRAV